MEKGGCMKKDAFYFPHDSNAKDDPKCIMLIEELGLEGYGIFWVLLELLRDQPEYKAPIMMIPAIARRYNSSAEKFKSVILRYGLFQVEDENFFFSESFRNRMKSIDDRRLIASEAGKKGMMKRWGSNNYLNNHLNNDLNNNLNKVDITIKEKESKEYKSKEEEKKESINAETKVSASARFKKPEYDEVLSFFIENGFQQQAQPYFDFYSSNGWKVGRNSMKDWKAAARNWINRSESTYKINNNGKHSKPDFDQVAAEWLR